MRELLTSAYLDDLKSFRWELFHYRHSKEVIKCLTRYYFKKYNFQHFAEEIIIAGYDLQNLNKDIRTEVCLHIPKLALDEFPSIRERDDRFWDLDRLFICLVYGNDSCYTRGIQLFAAKRPNELCKLFMCLGFLIWQLETWLEPSVAHTVISVSRKLPLLNNINHSLVDSLESYQNYFKYWKGRRYSNIVDAIDAILLEPKLRHKKMIEHFDRAVVVDVLIEWDVNVTTKLHQGHTALYYAVTRKNLNAIFKLLTKGSFIGSLNTTDPNTCSIDEKMFEKHFDNCITKCVYDESFIEIDFKNLISSPNECERCDGTCSDEMKSIELLSNSQNHKHLLVHPVISTFVLLKWNRLAFVLYIDFILYTIFTFSTISYILTVEHNSDSDGKREKTHFEIALIVSTSILTIYIASRRILHQIFSSIYIEHGNKVRHYLQCLHTIFIVVFVVILLLDISLTYRSIFATICILLIAFEIFILAGSLFWSFSKYYVMFFDVAMSSIKSFQLCIILLPAFAISFYLLLRIHTNGNEEKDGQFTGTKKEEEENSFSDFKSLFIKITAMSIGEYDVDDNNFDKTVVSTYLFIGFLFFISTVFMNLMNGLAVSDTQKIQSDAEATSLIQRVRLLSYYEGVKSYKQHWFRKKFNDTWIMKAFSYFTKINSLETLCHPLNTKIYIGPDNRVLVLRKDYRTAEQDSIIFDQNGSYLFSWISYFYCSNKFLRVDERIVQKARNILEMKFIKQKEKIEKNQLKIGIVKLEDDLNEIKKMVKQSDETTKHQFEMIMRKFDNII